MWATTGLRERSVSHVLLVALLTACGRFPAETMPKESSVPWAIALTVTPGAPHPAGLLSVVSPLEGTQMRGGEDLRIAFALVEHHDLPVEGASVQAELWTPGGQLLASLNCSERRSGNYLCVSVHLPLRGAKGTWHVVGKATWKEDRQAEVQAAFQVEPSISDMYQERYGFWIEHPHVYGLGTGFHNLSVTGGLHFEDWGDPDGSGCVILDNYRYDALGVTFATIEVHWRRTGFPADGSSAMAHAQSLAARGLHHQDPEAPLTQLSSRRSTFQGRPAWRVLGLGQEYYVSKAAADYPVEWLIFQCPGTDWVWSLVVSTDQERYLDHLRTVQEAFECPTASAD
jgi:hypothetical protein